MLELEAQLREKILSSPVLSDDLKEALKTELGHMSESHLRALADFTVSTEEAVVSGAQTFLDAFARGDTKDFLQT
jgi:hypothetical protein